MDYQAGQLIRGSWNWLNWVQSQFKASKEPISCVMQGQSKLCWCVGDPHQADGALMTAWWQQSPLSPCGGPAEGEGLQDGCLPGTRQHHQRVVSHRPCPGAQLDACPGPWVWLESHQLPLPNAKSCPPFHFWHGTMAIGADLRSLGAIHSPLINVPTLFQPLWVPDLHKSN